MSRPLYVVNSDTLIHCAEAEAENLCNLAACQRALGALVPAGEETILYSDYWPSDELSVPDLGAAIRALSAACQVRLDRGRVRIRIYKSGRRRYAWTQLLLAGFCVSLAIATLVFHS